MNDCMAESNHNSLRLRIIRAARVHFALVAVLMLSTVIFDAWNLITPDAVLQRWTLVTLLLVVTTVVWYVARYHSKLALYHNVLGFCLIFADIIVATFLVYGERGMASRSVMLYAVPIVVSGILANRRAVYATASIATAFYALAAVRYFVVNFNEGYKIELYGTIGLYSAVFFVVAAITSILITPDKLDS